MEHEDLPIDFSDIQAVANEVERKSNEIQNVVRTRGRPKLIKDTETISNDADVNKKNTKISNLKADFNNPTEELKKKLGVYKSIAPQGRGRKSIVEKILENGDVGDSIDLAIQKADQYKLEQKKRFHEKGMEMRKERNAIKKELGIRSPKESKFKSKSHEFMSLPISDKALLFVMNTSRSESYRDGVDICPRVMMGIPAYNKPSKKNAFEHLINIQEKILAARPNGVYPEWILLLNDTSMLGDRLILSRLAELKPTTHVAAPYGFESVRSNGKWFEIKESDVNNIRGCYMQGNMTNHDWDFIVGSGFKNSPRYRILIGHGPFIAVRGDTFMKMDFTEMAKSCRKGFFHYMADISLQTHYMGLNVAQIKSPCMQFDNIYSYTKDEDFIYDQSVFTTKWHGKIPASIYGNK